MRRVIISGGGTGGHIYPAITIARAIAELEPTEFLYVGSKIGLENTLIPKEGLPFVTLDVRGLERKLSVRNFVTLAKTAGSLVKAEMIIRKFKPDVVIGTGGFVCGPVLLAASLSGIPTLIQEQNVIPGVTNQILSRFVNKIALGYREAAGRFKRHDILVYTGNPVRKDVLTVSKEEGRKLLDLDPNKFTLLVAGGSRGARSINTAMIDVHKYFKHDDSIQILHITGDHEYDRVVKQLDGIDGKGRYGEGSRIIPYLHTMPEALAAADLAVYRAGAVGLAELTVRGVPSGSLPRTPAARPAPCCCQRTARWRNRSSARWSRCWTSSRSERRRRPSRTRIRRRPRREVASSCASLSFLMRYPSLYATANNSLLVGILFSHSYVSQSTIIHFRELFRYLNTRKWEQGTHDGK